MTNTGKQYDAIPPFNEMYLAIFDTEDNEISPKRELIKFKVKLLKDSWKLTPQNSVLVTNMPEAKAKEARYFDKLNGGNALFIQTLNMQVGKGMDIEFNKEDYYFTE